MSNAYLPLPTYLNTEPRYTTVVAVKEAMGITSDKYDDVVKQAIVTIESLIDASLNTSYPQDADPNAGTPEALNPAPIEGIPVQVTEAALLGAIKIYQLQALPVGGSEEWVGTFGGTESRRAFNEVRPLLLGLQRGWGFA